MVTNAVRNHFPLDPFNSGEQMVDRDKEETQNNIQYVKIDLIYNLSLNLVAALLLYLELTSREKMSMYKTLFSCSI